MEWHSFAMVLTIPTGKEQEWEKLLSRAVPPRSIKCMQRNSTLLLLSVEAEMEFIAIEQANQWLASLCAQGLPPFRVRTNAQPLHEIDG